MGVVYAKNTLTLLSLVYHTQMHSVYGFLKVFFGKPKTLPFSSFAIIIYYTNNLFFCKISVNKYSYLIYKKYGIIKQ